MTRFVVLAALALSACAASPPSTYQDRLVQARELEALSAYIGAIRPAPVPMLNTSPTYCTTQGTAPGTLWCY